MISSNKRVEATRSMERNIVPILGINVHSTERSKVLDCAWEFLQARGVKKFQAQTKPKFIVTPNPEIVYKASLNRKYAVILNKALIAAPDGVGLAWAIRVVQANNGAQPLKLFFSCITNIIPTLLNVKNETVPGRLLFEDFIELSAREHLRIFLLGGRSRVAEKTASKIQRRGVQVAWASGPWLSAEGEPASLLDQALEIETIKKINEFKPHFLFVAFGAPKQEYWLSKNIDKLEVGLGIGVGGTFEYYSGEVKTPPSILSNFGFEWFWRLITQFGRPDHFKRIFVATVLFPIKVYFWKLHQK